MMKNISLKLDFYQIIFIAVALRVLWALFVPVIPVSDSNAYDVFAQNIWLHGTYGWAADSPTSYWPVGTSAIYSVFYGILGHNYWPIIIFNIFCTVGIIYFSQKLCDLFFSSPEVGRITTLLLACWPTLIMFTTILGSELPYMLASMAAIYIFVHYNKNIFMGSLFSGILFAVAYYVRPLAVITLAICIFYLLIKKIGFKRLILHSSLCLFVMGLLVAPWAYRNYQLYGHLVTMSTNGGATLWMGNQENTPGGYMPLPVHVKGLDEYTRNKVLKDEAITYVKSNPLAFVKSTIKKFAKFHFGETIGVTWNHDGIVQVLGEKVIIPLKLLTQVYWTIVLLLSVLGVWHHTKYEGRYSLLKNPFFLIWLSTASVHSIIVAQDRYHLPVAPFVSAFAAYALISLKKNKAKKSPRVKEGELI